MIEKTQSFKTSDQLVFATLDLAQEHELATQFADFEWDKEVGADDKIDIEEMKLAFSKFILSRREAFVAILSVKPRKKRVTKKKSGTSAATGAATK